MAFPSIPALSAGSIYAYSPLVHAMQKLKELIFSLDVVNPLFSLEDLKTHSQWDHLVRMILSECKENTLSGLMECLFSMESLLLQNAIRSKKKDFERGRKIVEVVTIVGYEEQSYDTTHKYEKDVSVVEDRKRQD